MEDRIVIIFLTIMIILLSGYLYYDNFIRVKPERPPASYITIDQEKRSNATTSNYKTSGKDDYLY